MKLKKLIAEAHDTGIFACPRIDEFIRLLNDKVNVRCIRELELLKKEIEKNDIKLINFNPAKGANTEHLLVDLSTVTEKAIDELLLFLNDPRRIYKCIRQYD